MEKDDHPMRLPDGASWKQHPQGWWELVRDVSEDRIVGYVEMVGLAWSANFTLGIPRVTVGARTLDEAKAWVEGEWRRRRIADVTAALAGSPGDRFTTAGDGSIHRCLVCGIFSAVDMTPCREPESCDAVWAGLAPASARVGR